MLLKPDSQKNTSQVTYLLINLFLADLPILYLLKTLLKQSAPGAFDGCESELLYEKMLKLTNTCGV